MRISDWSSDVCSSDLLEAFMRVKRAGFKPSLNLLYALEGALQDCHWQEVPDERRVELVEQAEAAIAGLPPPRSEEHTSELQSLMRISYAVFCLKKKKKATIKESYLNHQ